MAPGRSAVAPDRQLSDFELQRKKRMEENATRMRALGIETTKAAIDQAATKRKKVPAASQRGLPRKRVVVPESERRRSSRIKGDAADGNEVTEELRGGKVVTKDMMPAAPDVPQERHSKSEIAFDSMNATAEEDAETLAILRRMTDGSGSGVKSGVKSSVKGGSKSGDKNGLTSRPIKSLSLAEHDVAKVTKAGTVHLSFMPGSSDVIAAGDKKGGVGIWRVNAEEREGSCDGVHVFAPHAQYVSGLVWGQRSGNQLLTASYDGSVRRLDVEKGMFSLVHSDEDVEYSALNSSGSVLYLGTNNGYLDAVDLRIPSRPNNVLHSLHVSEKKINTVDIDVRGTAHHLACSGTDCTVKVFDTRKVLKTTSQPSASKLTAPLLIGHHPRACQGAYFAPDGSGRIVSTSFDNTVRVWDSSKGKGGEMEDTVVIKHDNQTGRWVFPFRAVWSADSSSVVVGNMKRYLDVFDATTGKLTCQGSEPELMTAIPSRNCCSDDGERIAAATASGRVHLYRVE